MTQHVLYCHPGAELYGSDRMAARTVEALIEAGMTVTVVLPNGGPLVTMLEAAGARVSIVDVPVLRKSLLRPANLGRLIAGMPRTLAGLVRVIRANSVDTILVNTITQPWWILAGRIARKPVATHVREAESSINRLVQIALVSPVAASQLIVCNSSATRDHVVRNTLGSKRKTVVVYNGKDWTPYFRRSFAGLSDPVRVLFVGRLNARKGPDTAIEAIAELQRRGIDASLTLAGSIFPGYEWYEEELRDLAHRLGVTEACRFLGFVSDTEPLYENADVVIVPSRAEPFGTVAAEAMAAERPTVVSNVQGLVEIVNGPEVGLVFEAGDSAGLADRLQTLVAEPELAARLAVQGRRSVLQRFSVDQYSTAMVGLLQSLRR